jgi:hypothetical protein
MKWWFSEKADIDTVLPTAAVMEKVKSIARNQHGILDSLNPDHQFNDDYKLYVGAIGERDFRVKRKYGYVTSHGSGRTMSLIVNGRLEDNFSRRTLHLRFTVPATNLLWLLFPPLWMMIGAAYAADISWFRGIPAITLLALLLIFYLYWLVLAQFRRKVRDATTDFERVLQKGDSFYSSYRVDTR